jgi:hypothetical protein
MEAMEKYIIGAFIVIVLLAGGLYWWDQQQAPAPAPVQQEQTLPATTTYATTTFSIVYPSDYTVNASYQYLGVPHKPIDGVSFTVSASTTAGTNLAPDTYVSVESLPRAKICTGDIYLPENVKSETLDSGSHTYSVASSSEGEPGSLYEQWVYAIPGSMPCMAVRYYIHSEVSKEPNAPQPFDRSALISAFDAIRDSLSFGGENAGTSSAPMIPAPSATTTY